MAHYTQDGIRSDAMYSQEFGQYIRDFSRIVNSETTIPNLLTVMEYLGHSGILNVLMKDPRNEQAKSCVRGFLHDQPHLPQDFLAKFLSIVSLKINLTPNGLGFINQSYNAKVIATNIRPPRKLTNLTLNNRQAQLREEIKHAKMLISSRPLAPPQTIKLKFSDSLIPKLINSIADLSHVIREGNNSNGFECDNYIKTNMLR